MRVCLPIISCSSPAKATIIGSVLERTLEGLEKDPSKLPPLTGEDDGQDAGEALLWCRIFHAKHYDRLGETGDHLSLSHVLKFWQVVKQGCNLSTAFLALDSLLWLSGSMTDSKGRISNPIYLNRSLWAGYLSLR